MLDTESFVAIATARAGSRRGACIAMELAKLPVAYATAGGALGLQVASLFPVGVPMGRGYVGIAREPVSGMI